MKTFGGSHRLFTWLCVCPTDTSNKFQKFKNYLFTIFAFVIGMTGFFASVAFILIYLTTDLVNSLCAGFQVSGLFSVYLTLIMAYTQRAKVMQCFENFQQFYDSCQSNDFSTIV